MVPKRLVQGGRIMKLLTSEGRRRAAGRVKSAVRMRLRSALVRARNVVADLQSDTEVDHGGRRFLSVGPGTRVEPIMIDVRVDQQPRPYVRVGSHSHIGGQYVFERGLGEITIGSRSSVGGGCLFVCSQPDGIRIGDNVMVSWDVTVTDTDAHSLDPATK